MLCPMANDRQTILDFLRANPVGTISSIGIDDGWPQSALVAFAELNDLSLIFETFYDSRKYRNLLADDRISFTIGWDLSSKITLQYQGSATPAPDDKITHYRDIFLHKDTPCTEQFLLDSRVRLFVVKPTWIRYSDYGAAAPHIIEVKC